MTQKVLITEKNAAIFICPECGRSKNADVSKYKKIEKLVRLKIKCACGSSFSVVLERRKCVRKQTNLPGKFVWTTPGGQQEKGPMTVVDISREGLKLKVTIMPKLEIGATINVEFQLDDKQKNLIKKDAIVKNMNDKFISAEFSSSCSSDLGDKALRFYLF